MSRTIKIIFTISLLANILLLGMMGGYAYRDAGRKMFDDRRGHHVNTLPDLSDKQKELMKKLADGKKRGAELLLAEPFDQQAYVSHLQELEVLQIRLAQEKWQKLREEAGTLDTEQRRRLAERMKSFPCRSHEGAPRFRAHP